MTRKIVSVIASLTLATTLQSFAHSVWIEPTDAGQLVVRFAEPSGNLERSPGYLDSLTPPAAFTLVTNSPVVVATTKSTNHFLLVSAAVTNAAFVETSFTVRANRKPLFYARWQPAGADAGRPMLTFDLVPTGKTGEARAYFRGEPLGDVKAVLQIPDGDEIELVANSEGLITYTNAGPGHYLLTLAHKRERIAGVHLGVPYKETSHNCALVWIQE